MGFPEDRLATRRFRRQASCLVALFLATNLWSFLHAAAEQHGRCAEHGEVIHTGSTETMAGPTSLAKTTSSDATPSAPRPDQGQDEHDHCYLGMSSSAKAEPGDTQLHLLRRVLLPESARMPAARRAPTTLATYELAPKNSPPS